MIEVYMSVVLKLIFLLPEGHISTSLREEINKELQ